MKKLFELVTIVSNTEDAVVLKIKPNSAMELICLGCFNGDEDILRLTKGKSITCTIWTKEGKNYSWCWGEGGYTLVSDNMTKKGRMIQQCIEDEFDILVYGSKDSIHKAMNSTSKTPFSSAFMGQPVISQSLKSPVRYIASAAGAHSLYTQRSLIL